MFDREVDVVCVGSGLGGVTAALAAHDAGGEALILEKAPKLGGVCAYSGGEVFVPCNHKLAQSGRPDDTTAAWAYLAFLAGGYADPELAKVLFERGPEVAQWVEEVAGIPWRIIDDFPDYHFPKAPGTVAEGRYLETELFEGKELGPWQKKVYTTPHMPPGIRHDELFAWGGLPRMMEWDFQKMGARIGADVRGMGPAMMATVWLVVVTVWLYRSKKPWAYAAIPMVIVLLIAAAALTHKVESFVAAGKHGLAAVGVFLLVLEAWIVLEGVLAIRRSKAEQLAASP